MTKGENITLPYEQAQKVLNSPQQIIQVLNEEREWTGITINKAHIICTTEDFEAEKDEEIVQEKFRLEKPRIREEMEIERENKNEKRIKVPGGWQLPSVREKMIKLFEQMKQSNYFKEFKDYFEWEKAKYKE